MTRKRKERKAPPQRLRGYRIEAQQRSDPDLHKLAQVFIGLAMQRARAERDTQKPDQPDAGQSPDDPVE
ncbi:hypothetical protein [Bifidobacterium psychraerophilum]|uniref:Uncharacterized protein n=1 Tax=Bifidobacterium psychraerophilum TaxID=218140 RepID=A0A087CF92_9BIFI|nr:hypothetical protein [Bifidobacterium psychraerophilum]KFI81942.1 hypothetical protein BPSY_0790 [Bifidobacterium psychraerophilum]PKA94748.1 hypothetical protein A9A89_0973 [Bifidobacterium psychraerophilum DSM 22366]